MSLSCYPFYIQSHRMSVWRYLESLYNCTLYSNIWTMSQNAVNPLSPISENIQSRVNLSRQCIQFTPVKVHSNTITSYIDPLKYYIPGHNSLPYSQRILTSLVVRCTYVCSQRYLESYRTSMKTNAVTRAYEGILETTGSWVSSNLT